MPPGPPRQPQENLIGALHQKYRAAPAKSHAATPLSEEAWLYLTEWAKGTRRRHRRPKHYAFLQHRIGQGHAAVQAPPLTGIAADLLEPKWTKEPRPIKIRPGPCAGLEPEPAEDDGDAELRCVNY